MKEQGDLSELEQLRVQNKSLKSTVDELTKTLTLLAQFASGCDWLGKNLPQELEPFFSLQRVEGEDILCEATGVVEFVCVSLPFIIMQIICIRHLSGEVYKTTGTKLNGKWHGTRIELNPLSGASFSVNMVQGQRQGPAIWMTKNDPAGRQDKFYWCDQEVGHIIQTSDDGSMMYHCTDSQRLGVSVSVLHNSEQSEAVFGVVDGYQIRLRLYDSLIQLRSVVGSQRGEWVDYRKAVIPA